MASVSVGTQTTVQDLRLLDSRSGKNIPAPVNTGRLIYANPQDLPSFPSLGLKKDDAAAGAAASLGWANARTLTLWTPEKDASAQRAATLANDYRMPALPQAERNPTGSKTAAVLAAENANHRGSLLDNRHASIPASSAWGNSAATQAFASSAASAAVEPREPMTELNRQKSLRAARDAFAGDANHRARSASSPWTYPDSASAAANALSAATIAHRPTSTAINLKMSDVGAQPVTSLGSEMYTSHPPVKPEVDEKNHDEALHASAVAMAKKMFALQQKKHSADTAAAVAAAKQHDDRPGSADSDATQPMQFTNLQEAAYRLAQERLARLHEEHQRNRGMADYYGTSSTSPTSTGRRLTKSMSSKLRRRASSDGDVVAGSRMSLGGTGDDDRQRSRQIHQQMSLFSTRLDEVDESKQGRDREALLAAAQRNVKATLEGMDEKMYRDQGRVPPAKLNQWEAKAHEAAQARSEARTTGDMSGKVDLGGGQYMDREKVEEIAAKRVQPVLDEINEKAELERQRLVAQREEQEKKRLESEAEKAKNREAKEDARRLKEEEKIRKEEAKARKEEEKAFKAEEKRLAKEEKDKNKGSIVPSTSNNGGVLESSTEEAPQHKHRLSRPFTPKIQTEKIWPTNKQEPAASSSLSPVTSPDSATESHSTRVKNWLKSRLQRPRSKSTSVNSNCNTISKETTEDQRQPGAFIGGHALKRLHTDGTGSLNSLSEGGHSASMRDVALAGRPGSAGLQQQGQDEEGESSGTNRNKRSGHGLSGGDTASTISVNSSLGEGGSPVLGRPHLPAPLDLNFASSDGEAGLLKPPPGIFADPATAMPRTGTPRSVGSGQSNRDSRFVEIID